MPDAYALCCKTQSRLSQIEVFMSKQLDKDIVQSSAPAIHTPQGIKEQGSQDQQRAFQDNPASVIYQNSIIRGALKICYKIRFSRLFVRAKFFSKDISFKMNRNIL